MNLGNIEEKHIKPFVVRHAKALEHLPTNTIIWYHGCIYKVLRRDSSNNTFEFEQICCNKGKYDCGFFGRRANFITTAYMSILKLPENMNVETIRLLYGVE